MAAGAGTEGQRSALGTSLIKTGKTVLALLFALAACGAAVSPLKTVPDGDAETGRKLAYGFGCGSCHVIPGVAGADGKLGPSLARHGQRSYIAGALVNVPENLVAFIQDPRQVDEDTAMGNKGVTESQARHIAAYLYSLR